MTAVTSAEVVSDPSILEVATLRSLFRHLQAFRVLHEDTGQDTLEFDAGRVVCLWDLEYLYSQIHLLPERQCQAIEWFLVQDIKEADVAKLMGLKPQPVAMYATEGLRKLIVMVEESWFPRFRPEEG